MDGAVQRSTPVLDVGVSVFDAPEAIAINEARLAHLESLGLPLAGRSVIDVGCGVGHLARFFVERGCRTTCVDGRAENIEILCARLPGVEARVADVETDSLSQFGEFEIVFCYGLLYHTADPMAALRNMAEACKNLLILETIVTDHELPLLRLEDEPRENPNQALAGLGTRPSPAFVAKALKRCGFEFVYMPVRPPDHPEFQFEWRNNLDWTRDGHNLRCIFVASRTPLDNRNLTPVEADGRSAFSPEQALAEAQSLCWVRPLKPYPRWSFGADWENPDPKFRRRCDLWRYFNRHQIETPLDFEWYDGLRLWLYPGNDLSATLFVGGCNEPNEFAFLDRFLQPGMVFIDAGANDGLYSLFSSRRVGAAGRVFSFEPSARELERLRVNVERNGLANVTAYGVALGDQNGEAALSVADYQHEGHNTLGAFVYPAITLLRTERVPMRTLDDALAEAGVTRVDLIKIDVEGGETRLLAGAAKVIQKYRPVLLFEALDPALRKQGSSLEELLERIRSLSYVLYQFDPRTGLPAPVDREIDESSVNLLAAPAEAPLPVGWCAPPANPSEPGGASRSGGSSWLSRFLRGRRLRERELALFDLNTYTVCASSHVSGSGPLTVVTPAGQWHYAIHFPVHENVREKLPASAVIAVRLEGVVETGRIGVSIASADGSYFLAREVERGADAQGVAFELELAEIPQGATLVVRNTFAGSRPSTIRIDSISSRRL